MSDNKKQEEKKEELTELIEDHLDAVSGGNVEPHDSVVSTHRSLTADGLE